MTTRYVVLDTNIFVRFATQGKPGCEPEYLDHLLDEAEKGSIILLMPEVIQLECRGQLAESRVSFSQSVRNLVSAQQKSCEGKSDWNELQKGKDSLKLTLAHWGEECINEANERFDRARDISGSARFQLIPLTQGIVFNMQKRMLSQDYQSNLNKNSADNLIVESLVDFFRLMIDVELLICTENLPDFGIEVEGRFGFPEQLRSQLPPTQCFVNLATLSTFLQSSSPVVIPSLEELRAAQVRAHEERMRSIADAVLDWTDNTNNHEVLAYKKVMDELRVSEAISASGRLVTRIFRESQLLQKKLETAQPTERESILEQINSLSEQMSMLARQSQRMMPFLLKNQQASADYLEKIQGSRSPQIE